MMHQQTNNRSYKVSLNVTKSQFERSREQAKHFDSARCDSVNSKGEW